MIHLREPFDLIVGTTILPIPDRSAKVPNLMWESLCFGSMMGHAGYPEIERQQVERVAALLRQTDRSPEQSQDSHSAWYALCTGPQQERRVAASVAERGYSFFLPMETEWDDAAHTQRTMRPVFRGYVFVLCELQDLADLHGIEGVTGLFRYLRDGGLLWPRDFPAGEILALQIDERAGVFDYTCAVKPRYRPKKGEHVRITAGPYFNHVAKVLATPRGRRVKLLIEGFDKPRYRTEEVGHLIAA